MEQVTGIPAKLGRLYSSDLGHSKKNYYKVMFNKASLKNIFMLVLYILYKSKISNNNTMNEQSLHEVTLLF